MIRDERVLHPEFVPRDIAHRDHEVDELTNALEPFIGGGIGSNILLHGPSGSGKTCITQYAIEQLAEETRALNHQYVNCWENYSRFNALHRVLEGVGLGADIHRQSTAKDELLRRLRAYDGPPYIVILDEADQLEDKSVLYDLYRTSGLTMVLIANDADRLFEPMEERLDSRFRTARQIRFDRYTMDELVAILKDRVRWGLDADVSADHLDIIANAAAGDARVGIETLRVAAQRAESVGRTSLSDDIVESSVSEARSDIRQRNVETLTEHQRVVYDIIEEEGTADPGVLYREYRERVDDPKSNRMVRNYLRKMEQYNLVRSEGRTRGRTYHAVT